MCIWFPKKRCFCSHCLWSSCSRRREKANGWIRFDPLSRRLQIADQDKNGDSFFEISIHIQFSNPSHGNIEMYKMKAKNEYFLDCKLLCACQLVTSWEPLEETKIYGESSWSKKLKLYKVANWWIHETPWRESSPELLTAQPLKTNQDNGDKVDQDHHEMFFSSKFLCSSGKEKFLFFKFIW